MSRNTSMREEIRRLRRAVEYLGGDPDDLPSGPVSYSPTIQYRRQLLARLDRGEMLYTTEQMEQYGNERQMYAHELENRHYQEVMLPFFGALYEVGFPLSQTDTYAVEIEKGRLFGEALRDRVALLYPRFAASIDQLQEAVNRMREESRPAYDRYISEYLIPRREALWQILEGDNGAMLTQIIRQHTGKHFEELLANLTDIPQGGRPKGAAAWRYWLAHQWQAIEQANPEYNAADVWRMLLEKLRAKYEARIIDNPDEHKALESLEGQSAGYYEQDGERIDYTDDRIVRYRRRLLKSAGLWK